MKKGNWTWKWDQLAHHFWRLTHCKYVQWKGSGKAIFRCNFGKKYKDFLAFSICSKSCFFYQCKNCIFRTKISVIFTRNQCQIYNFHLLLRDQINQRLGGLNNNSEQKHSPLSLMNRWNDSTKMDSISGSDSKFNLRDHSSLKLRRKFEPKEF